MAEHNDTGKMGENIAKDFLIQKGYQILETNWNYKNTEIDLIAQKTNHISIIEVKTRSSNAFGEPATFVNKQKQKGMIQGAEWYCENNKLTDVDINFDIISIILRKDGTHTIEHIENAFYATL